MFILKQLRRKKNSSQTDLAQAIGVSLRTIQLYEKKGANIPIKNLTKIAAYFELTIAELYAHEVNEEEILYNDTRQNVRVKYIDDDLFRVSVPFVPRSLEATYIENYDDSDFIKELVQVNFIIQSPINEGYRAFEVNTKSMEDGTFSSIPEGSIVLGKAISEASLAQLLDKKEAIYSIINYDGQLLCKQIKAYNITESIIYCHSNNPSPEYADFELPLSEIKELYIIIKKQLG